MGNCIKSPKDFSPIYDPSALIISQNKRCANCYCFIQDDKYYVIFSKLSKNKLEAVCPNCIKIQRYDF